MIKVVFTIVALIFYTEFVAAQTFNPERAKEKIQEIYKEKLKTPFPSEEWLNHPSLKNEDAESNEVVVSGNDSEAESEIHAAINPTDSSNMVVSANKSSAAGNTLNYIYYTKDFGSTWKKSAFNPVPIMPGTFNVGGGDPVFVYDKNGRVYFTWISLNGTLSGGEWALYWAYSDDGGETWKRNTLQPYIAVSKVTGIALPNIIYDKQWLACDRSNGTYANTIYCAFFESNSQSGNFMIGLRKKDTSSNQFTSVTVPVSDSYFRNLQFCSIDVDAAGAIHVMFFGTKDDYHWGLYHSKSEDGGANFSSNVKISDIHLPGFSGDQKKVNVTGIDSSRLYPCPGIKADIGNGTYSGNLYAVWTANGIKNDSARGLDVYFSRSLDGGKNWSKAMLVNDNTDNLSTDQFYPTIDIKSDGGIAIFYYDRRNDPNNKMTDIYGSYSFDGGKTFNPGIKVTNQASDFSKIGSKNNKFGIGEYIQVLTSPSFAIPFWADGRTNDGEIDIYAALVPMANRIEVPLISYIKVSTITEQDNLYINISSIEDDEINYLLYDVAGRLISVHSQSIPKGETIIPIPSKNLSAGTYLVVVNSVKQGKAINKVLVKR